ncbi:Cytochrome c oxidase subunit 2 [Gryllus bimaculatus]|nr:Cytochrome c oxidase subunit 2 [Gryllus bimaculatus]
MILVAYIKTLSFFNPYTNRFLLEGHVIEIALTILLINNRSLNYNKNNWTSMILIMFITEVFTNKYTNSNINNSR